MRLCKVQRPDGSVAIGSLIDDQVRFLDFKDYVGLRTLSDILYADHPAVLAGDLMDDNGPPLAVDELIFLPPVDEQDIWAAGVTYLRSREARERESTGAASFYDLVYTAERPELFFKAAARHAVGHHTVVHIRRDSRWSVPEPELALVLSPQLKIVGYTIGNDMSSRDIEGENPLYLPQAKVYDRSCALGPAITLADQMPPMPEVAIHLAIERQGKQVFAGSTGPSAMKRKLEDLALWLGKENSFPHGAVLLTGTGIVPPDDFSLEPGDLIHIDITGIGRLTNRVGQRPST
jgi:2-dehydro-3-deoxy-D-arabinonate dehydratase